jgi:hypothetical protein
MRKRRGKKGVHAKAPKLGGGSSSGFGEFWNMELAKYPAFSLLILAGLPLENKPMSA